MKNKKAIETDFTSTVTKTYPNEGPYIFGYCVQTRRLDGKLQTRRAVLMLNGLGSRKEPGWTSKTFGPWEAAPLILKTENQPDARTEAGPLPAPAKHTPGPWTVHEYDKKSLGYAHGKAYGIVSDDGTPAFTVCKSQKFDHRNGKTGHFWDPSAKAKDKANAALIAACPELLSALEEVRDMLESSSPTEKRKEDIHFLVVAALMKAIG